MQHSLLGGEPIPPGWGLTIRDATLGEVGHAVYVQVRSFPGGRSAAIWPDDSQKGRFRIKFGTRTIEAPQTLDVGDSTVHTSQKTACADLVSP